MGSARIVKEEKIGNVLGGLHLCPAEQVDEKSNQSPKSIGLSNLLWAWD